MQIHPFIRKKPTSPPETQQAPATAHSSSGSEASSGLLWNDGYGSSSEAQRPPSATPSTSAAPAHGRGWQMPPSQAESHLVGCDEIGSPGGGSGLPQRTKNPQAVAAFFKIFGN